VTLLLVPYAQGGHQLFFISVYPFPKVKVGGRDGTKCRYSGPLLSVAYAGPFLIVSLEGLSSTVTYLQHLVCHSRGTEISSHRSWANLSGTSMILIKGPTFSNSGTVLTYMGFGVNPTILSLNLFSAPMPDLDNELVFP
jgi:hypothetical protein